MFDHLEDLSDFVRSDRAASIRDSVSIVNGGNSHDLTCKKCNGRGGKTYGYVNIRTFPCYACKGTGKTTAAKVAAQASAAKGRQTAAQNVAAKLVAFTQANRDVVEFLAANAEWSAFYRSMRDAVVQYGSLTDRQLEAVRSGMAKAAARKVEKEAAKATAPRVEMSAIEALFSVANASKLKRPVFRACDGIDISQAAKTGKNPGALYVKENGEYAGKIVAGQFHATRAASAAVLPRLLAVAANPAGEAKMYGKLTGSCGCCGRELTDPVSIENGIGPICATKWGL